MIMAKLIKLYFNESGKFKTQFNRPYIMDMVGDRLAPFVDATRNGERFTASAMRQMGLDAIGVSPIAGAPIAIAGGWGDRRCVFLMCVEIDNVGVNQNPLGNDRVYFVGWTNHPGIVVVNNLGRIDREMQMYFNSATRVRPFSRNQYTGEISYRTVDNIELLSGSFDQGFNRPATTYSTAQSMRPQDVFSQMSLNFASGFTINGTTNFSGGVKPNDRLHSMPDHYLSSIFTNLTDAAATYQSGNTDYLQGEGILDLAVDKSSEGALYNRPVFQELENEFGFNRRGYVLFSELAQIFPGIDNPNDPRVESVMLPPVKYGAYDFSGENYANLGGSDAETRMCMNLATSVPALMSCNGLAYLDFTATNDQVGGKFHIQFPQNADSVRSFADGLQTNAIARVIESELRTAILPPLDIHHNFNINLMVMCHLFSHTTIKISVNNGEFATMTLPTFASGLTSPCFDATGHSLQRMAEGVDMLRDHLVQSTLHYSDSEDLLALQQLKMQSPTTVPPVQQNGGINLFGTPQPSAPQPVQPAWGTPANGNKTIKLY